MRSIVGKIGSVAFVFVITACASKSTIGEATRGQGKLQIKNFGKEFSEFVHNARADNEKEALKDWVKFVESKDPNFFSQVVGGSLENADWRPGYEKSFVRTLPYFRRYESQIASEFARFEQKLVSAIESFSSIFPDFDIADTPIYGVPSLLRFNGQSAEVNKRPILAFGIDTVVIFSKEPNLVPKTQFRSNSDVLYAHEIFHIYHNRKQGFSIEKLLQLGRLINAAWNEGLATYASQIVNPRASDGELLMDDVLARECAANKSKLMRRFALIAQVKFGDSKSRDLYRDWFLLSSKNNTLPIRAGYCVGLTLVRKAAEKFSASEMASWQFEEVSSKLAPLIAE
jgi:hypothetical protein